MMRIWLGAFGALVIAVAPALAQSNAVRVRGTIEQVNGSVLTVKSLQGETLTVKLTDDATVMALVKASLADIKPGTFVGSTAMPEPNGHWQAVEVHIFPEAMRGTGEGNRPFDYKPKSTMTNGTVGAVATGPSTVGGSVAKTQGTTLTLRYKEGEKAIDVTPETVIVSYAPGSKDELKPGAQISIARATRQADGTLATVRVNVGRGVEPPT